MTDLEKKCIELRKSGATYDVIQKRLGSPSKKWIRSTLLQYAPDLIDNSQKKQEQFNPTYRELYGILIKSNKIWDIFDEKLYIKDHKIYYGDDDLDIYSEVEQSQILNTVKASITS